MTKAQLIVGAVVLVAILFLIARIRSRPLVHTSVKARQTYAGLRDMILQGSRTKFSLPEPSRPTEPWGVVMDWGVQNGTATVVALSDGTASVYLSGGGGFIGGVGQAPIRSAALEAVRLAAGVQPQAKETKSFPLPETGQVHFYFLTDAGVFAAIASEDSLRTEQSPFSKLGNAMQGIITQYRILEQKRQGQSS